MLLDLRSHDPTVLTYGEIDDDSTGSRKFQRNHDVKDC